MRDAVAQAFKDLGDYVQLEIGGLYADSGARHADVFVHSSCEYGVDRAIDCVVADPRGVEPLYSHNSDKKALAAATAAEDREVSVLSGLTVMTVLDYKNAKKSNLMCIKGERSPP